MTEDLFSKSFHWTIDECLLWNTQLDMKQFQMIWNLWKWWLQVECDKNTAMNEFLNINCETKQSSFEARLETIEQYRQMTNISASQHCLINTRILFCQFRNWCEYYTTKKQHYTLIQEIRIMSQAIHQRELCSLAIFSHFQRKTESNELRCWKQERCILTNKWMCETRLW